MEYPEKTTDLPTDKLLSPYVVHLVRAKCELKTLVVIGGNDCIDSCTSNYHTITTTTAPANQICTLVSIFYNIK